MADPRSRKPCSPPPAARTMRGPVATHGTTGGPVPAVAPEQEVTYGRAVPVNRVGVALVGPGGLNQRHVEAIAHVDGAEFRGALQQSPGTGLSGPAAEYLSWEQLLRDSTVQLVSFCAPGSTQRRLARQALEAGKAVLLEGIATHSTAELDDLVALSEQAGQPAGAMLPHRYCLPPDVWHGRWRSSATATVTVSRYRPPAPRGQCPQCGTAESLSRLITRPGTHYLDLVCQLLGPPADVHVEGLQGPAGSTGGRVAGVVRFASGGVLSFSLTCESPTRIERVAVLDVDQSLIIEDGRLVTDGADGPVDRPALHLPELRTEVYRDMTEAIRTGRPPHRCRLSRTRAVTTILERMYRQFESVSGGSGQSAEAIPPEDVHRQYVDRRPL
ncbi:Gfo/Idh/MocA family protein [Streptomyces chrestomyceticus]|uniref:Gfo/Idh/MocA family protein n=1 Tax=Streptomyces chrestomyceticus TaxID=68185 RepID=UPI0027DD4923|nr:Gfo/Idh/MocA family oxidoreductase [Streptomyces chrestomyceticus]